MEKITKVGLGIFKLPKLNDKDNASSNPFGVSFKGNVLQADVFVGNKKNTPETAPEKGKMFYSAIVGGINNFNEGLKSKFNSVVSFGRKMKEATSNSWQKLANTEISFDMGALKDNIKSTFSTDYNVNKLVKLPASDLEVMLADELKR